MPIDVDELIRSRASLLAERQPWEHPWQAISDTMLPAFNDITTRSTPGQMRTGRLYDSTGLHGAKMLGDHISSSVTNFQMSWFELRMGYEPLNKLKSVSMWLEAAAKAMQDKLSATTTPRAFSEKYRQFSGFGTGALFTDQSPLPGLDGRYSLLSRSLPIGTYCLAEDAAGMVDTMYRDLDLSPRQAIQHFGVSKVHSVVKERAEHAEMRHVPAPYCHVVYPRSDRDPSRDDQPNMPYASCYIDLEHKHLCSEGGYRWFPYMVSRWEKLRTWSPWGFGPGHIALPEVLTLNLMDRDILKALQMHILPPYWSTDPDAVGRVEFLPGKVNVLAHGAEMQPMRGPGDFNISHLAQEERRTRIRQAFYMDQLLTLPDAAATGKMTAYEVAQRVAYMQRLMGPAFMALLSEFLNPFIDIVFGTMLENDELPQPPDEVYMAALQGHGKITVDYQGPLARAQRGDEIQGIDGTLSMLERVSAIGHAPVVVDDYVDVGELIRRGGKLYGVSASIIRDKEDTDARQQARAEAEQEAQESQQMIEGAKALGPASQMVKAIAPAPQEAAA